MAKGKHPYFSARNADMNRQNGWGNARGVMHGIPSWKKKWKKTRRQESVRQMK